MSFGLESVNAQSKNKIDENGVDIQREHWKFVATWPQIWSFHIIVKTRTAKKCIKM